MFAEKIDFVKSLLRRKRLLNAISSYLSYGLSTLLRKSIVWGYPPILMIEPTNYCNLKCPLCPSGNGTMKRHRGYMDIEIFKKIIDEVEDKVAMIILWNQGEPFLHPNILEMIEYCSKKRIFTITSTNANHIPSPERLVRSGLSSMIVSLDGATQETYNKYRINGDIEKVIANTKAITSAKKQANSSLPLIKWQFIVMKHNEHEIDRIRELAAENGVDTISLKTVQIYEESDVHQFLPSNPKYRRYKIENERFILKKKIANRCRRIFTQPVINWDGEMAICCFDKDNIFKIGNIANNSLLALWHSDSINKVRQTILKNRKQIPICLNCGEGVKLTINKQ